jgi:hypothetical protein
MSNDELPELVSSFLKGKDDAVLKEKIYKAVLDLLMNNTSVLYQILYRVDVKEDKVKEAFMDNPMAETAAERITVLIIERQLEKIRWRQKYT